MCYSSLSLSVAFFLSASLPLYSFFSLVHVPLLVGWGFPFPGFSPLTPSVFGFPVVIPVLGVLLLLFLSPLSLGSFQVLLALFCLGRISCSLCDRVLPFGRVSFLWELCAPFWFACPRLPSSSRSSAACCFSPSPRFQSWSLSGGSPVS